MPIIKCEDCGSEIFKFERRGVSVMVSNARFQFEAPVQVCLGCGVALTDFNFQVEQRPLPEPPEEKKPDETGDEEPEEGPEDETTDDETVED